jgi:hypothetical protein
MNLQEDIRTILRPYAFAVQLNPEGATDVAVDELLQLINRIGEEVIGKDEHRMFRDEEAIYVGKRNQLRAEQRQRLSQLTGKGDV